MTTDTLTQDHFTHVNLVVSERLTSTYQFACRVQRAVAQSVPEASVEVCSTGKNAFWTLKIKPVENDTDYSRLRSRITMILNHLYTEEFRTSFLFYSFGDGKRVLEPR